MVIGSETSTISAPAAFAISTPWRHAASMAGGMSSTRYSFGTPTRMPLIPSPSAARKSGSARSDDVESLGSCPAIAESMIAASSTVRASGPGWSSEEAKATTPQREQRP